MDSGPRRGAAIRTYLVPMALMACLAALVAAFPYFQGLASGAKPEDTGSKAVPAPRPAAAARVEVHALAQLAPEAGLINVGARPGVRIDQVAVKEGDEIAGGAVVAVLEGHAQAQLQLALAEAQKKAADHQRALGRDRLAVERQGEDRLRKDRLDTHQQLVDLARKRVKAATDIYGKIGKPLQDNPAQRHELDLGFYAAEAEAIKAEIGLKELQVSQDLIAQRRAVEDRQLADSGPDTDVLNRQIELARANLDQTRVLAPRAGRILEITAHVGEVSSGPILTLGDVSAMVAVAEVYQSDVPEVKVGDPAEVIVLGKAHPAKVTKISRLVGKNSLASLDPRAPQDRRVVAVTIKLDDAAAAADYVNMEVEVKIRPRRSPGGGSR
jgi:HlyD family secretion protein